ncbi:UDP-glucose 4-epimerase GalE [Gammaproteobacteria bacterium]|nr:UDP-glucose 4-epimerase GalE [Gammaproteobacteria bacterium]
MNILLTGGAGYIGSHTCVMLKKMGFSPVIYDNFSNSNISTIQNINKINGVAPDFVKGDILDFNLLKSTLKKYEIAAVIHFAGLKSVKESIEKPHLYHKVNVQGSKNLVKAMQACNIFKLIFSSSATVYGDPKFLPISEDHPLKPKNPYGISKLEVEKFLEDLTNQNQNWKIVSLRYFNPIGAHESGLIYENSNSEQNNIMPVLLKIALGKSDSLDIYGNNYDTKDGTGIRDYIHVMDLADAHCEALNFLNRCKENNSSCLIANLGTGSGYSVLELINQFHKSTNIKIPYQFKAKRIGDIDISFADPSLAHNILSWKTKRGLDEMCSSSWHAAQLSQQ